MRMQQATNVPKSLIDTITAVFIIFACMELIGEIKKRSAKKADEKNASKLRKKILERYEKDKTSIGFSRENRLFVEELKHPKLMWLYWKIKSIM